MISGHVCGSASGNVVAENMDIAGPVTIVKDMLNVDATGDLSIQIIRVMGDNIVVK